MANKVYNVGKLKSLIAESYNEFKPVVGDGVEKSNKTNNDKAYKDAEKRAKDYDGGLKVEKRKDLPAKEDYNRGMLGLTPRVEPSKEYKEKIEAQAKGYTSKLEQDNGIEKNGDFDGAEKILKQVKDENEKINKERNDLAKSGLQARELDLKEKPTMTENRVAKRLTFKQTRFINEAQMLSRIPEMYKVDGQKIFMNDAHGNEYIVECVRSQKTGAIETNVVSFSNKNVVNEQLNRIQQLMNYNTKCTSGKNSRTLNENKQFEDLLSLSRNKK